MPDNLIEHKQWTRREWTTNTYMKLVIDHLRIANVRICGDFGGCTGEFTNILLDLIPTIRTAVILEPIAENYQFILDNVVDERVQVFQKALFESSTQLSLGRIDGNVGGWSLNWEGGQEIVPSVSLEELHELFGFDFVKIDIEGSERDILEYSEAIHQIPFIEIEFHDQYLEPEDWIPYAGRQLPHHRLEYRGDNWCRQNGFFVKVS